MSHMRPIDMESWARKAHFDFFQNRKNPCFSVTAPVPVGALPRFRAERAGTRIRLTDLLYHAVMTSGNDIPEFRLRLVDRRPVLFSTVHAAFTYLPAGQELHANCIAAYDREFSVFSRNVQAARDAADAHPTLTPAGCESQGLIYLTCVPDIPFTAVTNPWDDPWIDSVPRIALGRIDRAARTMPVSVEALHSFIDGRHVAAFLAHLGDLLAHPEAAFAA